MKIIKAYLNQQEIMYNLINHKEIRICGYINPQLMVHNYK